MEPVKQKRRGRKCNKIIDADGDNATSLEKLLNKKGYVCQNTAPARPPVWISIPVTASRSSIKPKQDTQEFELSSDDIYDSDDTYADTICYKCKQNEACIDTLRARLEKYEKKEKNEKSIKVYNNKLKLVKIGTDQRVKLRKTTIKCFWDGNQFDGLPCMLPEVYSDGVYYVTGCFCSFNCMLAYNLYFLNDTKVHHRKSLAYKMYRDMHNIPATESVEIVESPPFELLQDYGGTMTIEEYRKTMTCVNKKYVKYFPYIREINSCIEQRSSNANEDDNRKYILKRSKKERQCMKFT